MAGRGIQDISKIGIKFDNSSYNTNTWYTLTSTLDKRSSVLIINQGVSNDMATGIVYVSLRSDATVESAAVTTSSVIALKAGDSYDDDLDDNIRINVQGDTLNVVCYVQELDRPMASGDTF